MESTSSIENNIPISKISVVRETTELSSQEDIETKKQETGSSNTEYHKKAEQPRLTQNDIENRNQATGLSNQEVLQEQGDNQLRLMQKISYWNGLYAIVILATCVAWTSTITIIPMHNKLIYPDFWNENIVKGMHGYDGQHEDMKAFYLLDINGSKILSLFINNQIISQKTYDT